MRLPLTAVELDELRANHDIRSANLVGATGPRSAPCEACRLLATLDETLAAITRLSTFVYNADPSIMDAFLSIENGTREALANG